MAVLLTFASAAAAQSNLQRVLALLDQHPLFRSPSILANIAETIPGTRAPLLQETVDGSYPGLPITAALPTFRQSDFDLLAETTLFLADALHRLQTRLNLEPGWMHGTLAPPAVFGMTTIDASVTNLHLRGNTQDMTGRAHATGGGSDHVAIGEITATAIAASNTGSILTEVQVVIDNAAAQNPLDLMPSEIAQGGSQRLQAASTGTTDARTLTRTAAGGGADTATFAINLASNRMDVTGAVRTIVQQQSVELATIMTTVIGAVNAGETRPH